MARPIKDGLTYFPLDVDFFRDRKIRSIKVRYGMDGIALYLYILCLVYEDKGYYTRLDTDFYEQVEDDLGISENSARQIMNYFCERSMLDGTLLTTVKILTSVKIQETFQAAKRGAKREIKVNPDYWLLKTDETLSFIKCAQNEDFSENNGSFSEKNPGKYEKNSLKKSKEKESKVNKIKEKKNSTACGVCVSDDLKKIISKLEDAGIFVSSGVAQAVSSWLGDTNAEIILYAVEQADKRAKRSWRYIEAILNNLKKSGVSTMAQIEEREEQFRLRNMSPSARERSAQIYGAGDMDYDELERKMNEKYK